MSTRLEVLAALKALIQATLPGALVIGLDGEDAAPSRIPPDTGRVIVHAGDPGEPEVDLGPLTYWYEHRIPLEVAAYKSGGRTSEETLDDMLTAIGAAVEADRYLGGRCIWLEATAPATDDFTLPGEGGRPPRNADLMLVASYGAPGPLS